VNTNIGSCGKEKKKPKGPEIDDEDDFVNKCRRSLRQTKSVDRFSVKWKSKRKKKYIKTKRPYYINNKECIDVTDKTLLSKIHTCHKERNNKITEECINNKEILDHPENELSTPHKSSHNDQRKTFEICQSRNSTSSSCKNYNDETFWSEKQLNELREAQNRVSPTSATF